MKPLLILPLAQLLLLATASAQTTSTQAQERLRDSQNVTGDNLSGLAPTQTPSGFIFIKGNVYVVMGGRAVPLTHEMSFRVTPLGFVGFNGAPQNIPAGSMLSMDGQLTAAPSNLVDVTGNTIVLPAFNQQAGGLNGGLNASGNMNNQGNNNGNSQNQSKPQQQNGVRPTTPPANGASPTTPPANGASPTTPPANGASPTTPPANGASPATTTTIKPATKP